jgi:hypothetical protein
MTRNFNRQMWTIQDLELPPSHGNYIMRRFETHEIGNSVQVVREYFRADLENTIGYHESMIVGPHGGLKHKFTSTIYS